jgi:Arc/MetJ-type ribon-helix-helix transcriptional regulator
MATTKITITLDAEQVRSIRELVEAGKASTVSGFVQHAVRQALDDVAGWRQLMESALRETGGPMTKAERAWADSVLDTAAKPKTRPRRRSAA